MKVGDLEIVQVLDGEWITPAAPGIPQMTAEERAQHGEYLLPDGRMKAALGAFLVRTGDQVVLIDAGLGPAAGACESGSCGHADHQQHRPQAQSSVQFEEFFREKGASEAQIRWYADMLSQQSHETWLAGGESGPIGRAPGRDHGRRAVPPSS